MYILFIDTVIYTVYILDHKSNDLILKASYEVNILTY